MRDKVVTVFGGSGFLGRYIVRALLREGARVRVAARDPKGGWFLKTQGELGQTQFVAADVRRPDTVARALDGSWGAVNLVGILKGDFDAFHAAGARNVAEAAAAAGCERLAHISAIGASADSPSHYGRSKAAGEAAVRAAFPGATILRPSVLFGREDGFINRFAGLIAALPVVPVIRGNARFQPVFVGDVAEAVARSLGDARFSGATFDIGGPEILSMAAINRWIAEQTGNRRMFVAVPDFAASMMASGLGWAPGAPITRDQLASLSRDSVIEGVDGLAAIGIVPTPLAAVADDWLVRYRRGGRFAAGASE